ncbi:hypothetical protein ANN_21422 [Periplaneta americana]|uniref:PiggyBac transposable element-derived protein domain-containing protein n=1 Tax=Periplaneta americana TaxID=6978 RepID=A0ABQ8SFK9_PERAM|nr:hypothetical protein ANN_21422 [Periplaneta americana]
MLATASAATTEWWSIFAYFVDVAVVNAWLLYRKMKPQNSSEPLLNFRRVLALTVLKRHGCLPREFVQNGYQRPINKMMLQEKLPISCCRTRNLTVEEILTTLEEKDDEIQKAETIDLVILPPDNENDTDIDEIPEEDLEVNVNDPHFLGPGVLGRGAEVRIVTHEKEKVSLELNSSSTAAPLDKTAITTPEAPSASATKRKSSDGVAYSKKEERVMENVVLVSSLKYALMVKNTGQVKVLLKEDVHAATKL